MKYKIKKGDTLSAISKKFGVSIQDIARKNNIKNINKIYAGDEIDIPIKEDNKIYDVGVSKGIKITKKKSKKQVPKKQKPYWVSSQNGTINTQDVKNAYSSTKTTLGEMYDKASEFVGDVYRTLADNDLNQIPIIIRNGMSNRLGLEDTKTLSSSSGLSYPIQESDSVVNVQNYKPTYPSTQYGDTIWHTYLPVSDRQVLVPVNMNIDEVTLAHRNRGSRTPINNTEGVAITSYRPFSPYEQFRGVPVDSEGHTNMFFGYDSNGKFKVGTLDKFGPGDVLAQTFYEEFLNTNRNSQGDYVWTAGFKDGRRFSPTFRGVTEGGDTINMAFPLMTPKNTKESYKFDNVVGGGMLVQVGDETRLIRGSIDQVVAGIEDLQRRHPGEKVMIYEIDNASYNRGLQTRDRNFTEEDLKRYDAQNNMAGHFLYITPQRKAQSIPQEQFDYLDMDLSNKIIENNNSEGKKGKDLLELRKHYVR